MPLHKSPAQIGTLEELEKVISKHQESCRVCRVSHFDDDVQRWLCMTGKALLKRRQELEGAVPGRYKRLADGSDQ